MIVVIADDFSGAAELAGIAAARGLSAEVHTVFDPDSSADLIAIDTDTRLRSAFEAADIVGKVAKQVADSRAEWIYKKTDSVLRGHVTEEILAILSATGKEACLYIPANPSKGRIIRDGSYFIDGTPLSETIFREDPDYPRQSMHIDELMATDESILVPDVTSLDQIPETVSDTRLPAGAADFFTKLLDGREIPIENLKPKRTLLVCGSLAAWDTGRPEEMRDQGFLVKTINEPISPSPWEQSDRIMLAIGHPRDLPASSYLPNLVEKACLLLEPSSDIRLAVEGGATAIALVRKAGWERFAVIPENHVGVGSLRPPGGPLLSIKPGSYPWPDGIFSVA